VTGQSLLASPGMWSGSPSSFTFAWLRCDAAGNACVEAEWGGVTFLLGALDVGATMRVRVTASTGTSSTAAVSAASDVVVAAVPPAPPPPVSGALHVSPSGSDSGNGSLSSPFRTLAQAQAVARPGMTVYLQGGIYPAAKLELATSGTAASPITYTSYPGETAVLDGTGAALGPNDAILTVTGDHIVVSGVEIRNSSGRGVTVYHSNGTVVRSNKIHDVRYAAISASGDNLLIERNEIWNAAMVNAGGAFVYGGWPAALATYFKSDAGEPSTNITLRSNNVHDSWGEGILLLGVDGASVDGNTVSNTYSVLLYVDESQNAQIVNNYLSVTNPAYNRVDNGRAAMGINIAEESTRIGVSNLTIANNLIAGGTDRGISFWWTGVGGVTNSYSGVKIYYNTIKDTNSTAIVFDAVGDGSPAPSGNELRNNIVYAGASGGSVRIGQPAAWTFSTNVFPDGIPAVASGPGTLAVDPQLVNPVRGGPAEGFKVTAGSPLIGKATGVPITRDYFATPRSISATIGFHEYR
jgi:parallel beta-helix repeat protein